MSKWLSMSQPYSALTDVVAGYILFSNATVGPVRDATVSPLHALVKANVSRAEYDGGGNIAFQTYRSSDGLIYHISRYVPYAGHPDRGVL
ncbi:hypothetical protein [Ensifer sp. Root142]|uniref:hypothetical protein n=1 Tax=Ensifer sp. Root142 TaxID=1736461 RepID=UPI0012E98D0E|nr:hypothetical protein [Ensifer sp. Root142]